MIRISTLGRLELTDADGQPVQAILSQSKPLALLLYLAVAAPHGFHRRDILAALFWPESDTARARASLSKAIHHLRRALGTEAIVSRGMNEVGIKRELVWSDAEDFERLLDAGELDKGLALYRGELLPGFFLADAAEFERWLDSARSRLRGMASTAIRSLTIRAAEEGDLESASRLARRALEVADDERALRTLISLLDRAGDRAGALREYDDFAGHLEAEYDATPAPETRALIEAIRAREMPSGDVPVSEMPIPPRSSGSDSPEQSGIDGELADITAPGDTAPTPDRLSEVSPSLHRRLPRRYLLGSLFGAVLLAVGAVLLGLGSWADRLRENRVLIATFENRSDDPALEAFGRMTAEWIAQELAGTGLVDVVDPVTAFAASADLAAATARGAGSGKAIRAAARSTGARLVVSGSYYRESDSIRIDAWVNDLRRGEVLASVGPVYGDPADPQPGLELLRARVAGAVATALDPRIEAIGAFNGAPPRYAAYQAWMAGIDHFGRLDFPAAIPELERAFELDSTFLPPLIWNALAHSNLLQWERVDTLLMRLDGVREELQPFDRYFVDYIRAHSEGRIVGEYEAARRMIETAPGSAIALYLLGQSAVLMNRPEEALDAMARVRPELVPPDFQIWLASIRADAYHMVGRYEAELELVRQVQKARPGSPLLINNEFAALAALGRTNEVRARAEAGLFQSLTMSGWAWNVVYTAALELRAHGYPEAALELVRRAEPIIRRLLAESPDDPQLRRYLAQILYLTEDWRGADELFSALASESPESYYDRGFVGLLAALQGERPRAEAISADLARTAPPRSFGEPTAWRARIAAALGADEQAVELLHQALNHGYRNSISAWHAIPEFRALDEYPSFQEFTRIKRSN